MQCELCGTNHFRCNLAIVDGVRMMLCPSCMRHGQGIKDASPIDTQRSVLKKIKKSREKDVYVEMNKNLVSGWNDLIKKARKRKGLSREELGFNIGERKVTIAKIENGNLRPSDDVINKLEKELGITLIEEINKVSKVHSSSRISNGLTIGDFFRTENK